MRVDARVLPNDAVIEADLAIVGAGPAGLTLAREFIDAGVRLVLIESGGMTADPAAQALCDGTTVGDRYAGPFVTRRRQAGGTVHSWNTRLAGATGAKYVPLDPTDFEDRPWVPLSGWPFAGAALQPYYVRAHDVCGLGRYGYAGEDWAEDGCRPLELRTRWLRTGVYRFGNADLFTDAHLTAVSAAGNITVLLHASAVELETDGAAERVRQIRLRCLSGTELQVRAANVVLATGGIENARLLLLSTQHAPGGLGNRHGWVGRCFMEHPRDTACGLVPRAPDFVERSAFYALHETPSGGVMGRLALTEAALADKRLLNASVTLLLPDPVQRSPVRNALRALIIERLRWMRPAPVRLLLNLEQAPDPANGVSLGTGRDALGLPLPRIEWRWRDTDQRQLERLRALLAAAMESAGLGLFISTPGARPDPDAHHHLGTTRMHPDERYGVVDADGRVHGTDNLFIAGSSVFPTGGYANPTLTIVALAIRLADHLKSLLHITPLSTRTEMPQLGTVSVRANHSCGTLHANHHCALHPQQEPSVTRHT